MSCSCHPCRSCLPAGQDGCSWSATPAMTTAGRAGQRRGRRRAARRGRGPGGPRKRLAPMPAWAAWHACPAGSGHEVSHPAAAAACLTAACEARIISGSPGTRRWRAQRGRLVHPGTVARPEAEPVLPRPPSHHRPPLLHSAPLPPAPRMRPRQAPPNARSSASMRAIVVKRAYGSGPVATRASGLSGLFFWILLRSCPVLPSRGQGQAGAPAAAQRRGRTSLTPASGGRSSKGEEGGSVAGVWLVRGRVPVPARG
jgi:hypothetical protein